MKKNIQDGSLYFRERNILRPIGGCMTLAGLAMVAFGWSWAAYVIACVLVPLGLVIFCFSGSRFVSEKDMAEKMAEKLLDYDRPVTDMLGYESTIVRVPAPFAVSAYSFGDDAAYFKWTKGSTVISDRYVKTHFFLTTSDTLLVIGRRLSLTELDGEAAVADFFETYLLSGVTASVEEHTTTVNITINGKPAAVKWYEFVLTSLDGEELLHLPVPNDLDMTNLCETINRKA